MKALKLIYCIVIYLMTLPIGMLYGQTGPLEEILKNHVKILSADSLEGRGLGTDGKLIAEQYIVSQFEQAGIMPWQGQYRHPFKFRSGAAWIPGVNLIGFIPGTDPDLNEEIIVLGAHYDHMGYKLDNNEKVIYSGADDNASGVASIIELGRHFSKPENRIKRGLIIVAFDAEESGLHGSKAIIRDTLFSPHEIKIMFSLDMVGMLNANKGIDLKGIEALETGKTTALKHAGKFNISVNKMGPEVENRTDTEPFGRANIPSVHVFTGLKSPYHKPEDKYDLLDYEGMARINLFLRELITDLGNQDELKRIEHFEKIAQPSKSNSRKAEIGLLLMNGSGHHRYPETFYRARKRYIFNVGLYSTIYLNKFLALQPEILFDLNRSAHPLGTFNRYSLTTPLSIQIGTPTQSSGFRFYVFGGVYHRYSFGGRLDGESLDFDQIYTPSEWGLNTGLAINFMRFTVGWTYRRGFSNIYRSDQGTIKDTNGYFTLGYRF